MDFDSLLPEMGMILCNTHRYQQAIDFSKEVLELFSWEYIRAVDLYDQNGDNKKAEHFKQRLVEIHSSFSDDVFLDIEDEWNQKPVVKEDKIYPNDPCPCGSGKKYKKCCGKN